jgi:hypothetical protein
MTSSKLGSGVVPTRALALDRSGPPATSCKRWRGSAAFRWTFWRSASSVATFSATFTQHEHIPAWRRCAISLQDHSRDRSELRRYRGTRCRWGHRSKPPSEREGRAQNVAPESTPGMPSRAQRRRVFAGVAVAAFFVSIGRQGIPPGGTASRSRVMFVCFPPVEAVCASICAPLPGPSS